MTNYILRTCPGVKTTLLSRLEIQLGRMIGTVGGHCESCGYDFDWVLLRG
jgi:hypothetical protein